MWNSTAVNQPLIRTPPARNSTWGGQFRTFRVPSEFLTKPPKSSNSDPLPKFCPRPQNFPVWPFFSRIPNFPGILENSGQTAEFWFFWPPGKKSKNPRIRKISGPRRNFEKSWNSGIFLDFFSGRQKNKKNNILESWDFFLRFRKKSQLLGL
jgi:hypothetical protein